ncbi:MAG: hypothetical protein Tsb0033_08770 [Winogradskyella sp.]
MAYAQVTLNQTDDFQDGTTQEWRIGGAGNATNGPINVADAGPSGLGDNCLQYTSLGGSGVASKMVFYSQNQQWSGDFTSEGIDQINMDVNVQTNDLNLRIAMQGTNGTRICTTNAISVAANGTWSNVTFPISATDFTVVSGGGDAASVLSGVFTVRILSSSSPTWDLPDIIAATIQVDNITASSSLSIADLESNSTEFTISPNPSKNKLNVFLPLNEDMNIEVFDILGKRVYKGILTQMSSSVNVSNWKSGVYLVRVYNDKISQTKRFVKQ